MRESLLAAGLAFAPLSAAASTTASEPAPAAFASRRDAALDALRGWFLDDADKAPEPLLAFSTADEAAHPAELSELRSLDEQIRLLRRGRDPSLDDWQGYSDMAAALARRLGVEPPESAIPVYRGRVRPEGESLSPRERALRGSLAALASSPSRRRRCVFIAGLLGAPPPPRAKPRVVYVRNRRGRRIKRIIRPPEQAPPPKPISVLGRIDWGKADELAEVADDNAHGWERRPRESLRRYRRRLRRLRAHCYEWVRRDLQALGIWDARLFRGYVPPTRRDRKRPIRAASFALAMAKVQASRTLSEQTSLRELNLRIDPLVRGAIVVFSPRACHYNSRSGHIEIVTSVDPLRAASFKFHDVKTNCLVTAAKQNKVHVYVPVLQI